MTSCDYMCKEPVTVDRQLKKRLNQQRKSILNSKHRQNEFVSAMSRCRFSPPCGANVSASISQLAVCSEWNTWIPLFCNFASQLIIIMILSLFVHFSTPSRCLPIKTCKRCCQYSTGRNIHKVDTPVLLKNTLPLTFNRSGGHGGKQKYIRLNSSQKRCFSSECDEVCHHHEHGEVRVRFAPSPTGKIMQRIGGVVGRLIRI